jgi:hypothetical protein
MWIPVSDTFARKMTRFYWVMLQSPLPMTTKMMTILDDNTPADRHQEDTQLETDNGNDCRCQDHYLLPTPPPTPEAQVNPLKVAFSKKIADLFLRVPSWFQ